MGKGVGGGGFSSLTFLVAARHPVPVEAGEVPLDAQAESVPRPLQHAALVGHPAREGHVLALRRRLVQRTGVERLRGDGRQIGGGGGGGRGVGEGRGGGGEGGSPGDGRGQRRRREDRDGDEEWEEEVPAQHPHLTHLLFIWS